VNLHHDLVSPSPDAFNHEISARVYRRAISSFIPLARQVHKKQGIIRQRSPLDLNLPPHHAGSIPNVNLHSGNTLSGREINYAILDDSIELNSRSCEAE